MAQQKLSPQEADSKAKEILTRMSLKQKVYEMHGHGLLRFGASIVFGKEVKPIKAGGNAKLGIPSTIFLDGPRGVSLYKGTTAFPCTMARGASWDPDLEERIGEAMAEEILALGGNYSGAVCMNLLRHPAWGRAQETYGEDPHHVGEMASALVAGLQKFHVQACAKHFAANSMENNRFGGSMNMDERTLQEVYLPHFKKVVQRGVASIMSAYNKLNGTFCGENELLLTKILRDDWGFTGYVTSDWTAGLYNTERGIKAGMNIEMPSAKYYSIGKVIKALKAGQITIADIDALVLPILRTKILFGAKEVEAIYTKEILACKEHTNLAQEAAEKSAVLLKNENNFLPLERSKVKKVAIVGSLANTKETGDHGSSAVFAPYVISPLEGIRNYFKETEVEVLTTESGSLDDVKRICASADAVIVVAGTSWKDEGEYLGVGAIRDKENPDKGNFITKTGIMGLGGDRKYLHLHAGDMDIIQLTAATNKNVVVTLIAGAAITVEEWQDKVPAIIQTFYNGMEGGHALARILFGDVNPSGKLPFTVPLNEADLPPFNSFDSSVDYGYYHGYTLFDKTGYRVRYPFGYGLSYTDFNLHDLDVQPMKDDSLTFSVQVENKGEKSGSEVVQAYVSFPKIEFERPVKLLRAFKKIALNAGEDAMVQLSFPISDLAYFNPESRTWQISEGRYTLWVGNSSNEESLISKTFEIYRDQ